MILTNYQEVRGLNSSVKDVLSTEELIYLRNIHINSLDSIRKASCQVTAIK